MNIFQIKTNIYIIQITTANVKISKWYPFYFSAIFNSSKLNKISIKQIDSISLNKVGNKKSYLIEILYIIKLFLAVVVLPIKHWKNITNVIPTIYHWDMFRSKTKTIIVEEITKQSKRKIIS